jgi:DNA-directed RNA polymerase specialized sigma24 family protein
MTRANASAALRHVRRLLATERREGLTDAELLDRFLTERSQDAFAALVRRHGGLVLGVCRRVLRHAQDAEDAFQATFLVLARKADSLRRGEAVGGWLYRVAYRLALRARAGIDRRRAAEGRAPGRPRTPWQASAGARCRTSSTRSCPASPSSTGRRWCCATWRG